MRAAKGLGTVGASAFTPSQMGRHRDVIGKVTWSFERIIPAALLKVNRKGQGRQVGVPCSPQ